MKYFVYREIGSSSKKIRTVVRRIDENFVKPSEGFYGKEIAARNQDIARNVFLTQKDLK